MAEIDDVAFEAEGSNKAALTEILRGLGRSGSNSIAIALTRSKSGAAMIAKDPHLGLIQPNFWLLAGIKSPSYHAVGMMIPGLPCVALGRSRSIAWGGTNARARGSDLVDVSELPGDCIIATRERVRTRLWRDKEIKIRLLCPCGPIISDSPSAPASLGETLAIKWGASANGRNHPLFSRHARGRHRQLSQGIFDLQRLRTKHAGGRTCRWHRQVDGGLATHSMKVDGGRMMRTPISSRNPRLATRSRKASTPQSVCGDDRSGARLYHLRQRTADLYRTSGRLFIRSQRSRRSHGGAR